MSRSEVEAWVGTRLDPGEKIEAVLSMARCPHVRMPGVLGLVLIGIGAIRADHRAVVVTDRSVYLLDVSNRGKPKSVVGTVPRSDVSATYGRAGFEDLGCHALSLRAPGSFLGGVFGAFLVRWPHKDEAKAVVASLSLNALNKE